MIDKSILKKWLQDHDKKRRLVIMVEAKKEGYDWKIAGKKFLWNAGIVLLSGLVVVWQDDVKYAALIPVIKLALNWIKHRNV